ncbi:hypothetical protein GOP47_0010950 [Adiantum capillus-veneris]|uniref:Uncharacterized protein n=1 Tax=Adiantum capillus-veneris TaxID=13818 RepID=A0A9D4UVY0_ADICA|nr:hypothetical protein GOP47_0010950 [Adiantum capillus-veneris]
MLVVETPHALPHISCGLGAVEQAAGEKSRPSSRKVCFSFAAYAKNVINHMRKCQIPIAEGLTDEEFCNIESTFGFTFPPDLEAILQEGLPVGEGFPHWRNGSHAEMQSWLHLPIKALCSEVMCGRFWPSEWGVRPNQSADTVRSATNELKRVPTLVPVYANCYISCFPVQAGNPVFLVQDSTILYCGYDLADFFKRQAFVPRSGSTKESPMFELHSGLTLIKEQITLQRNSLGGANDGSEVISSDHKGPGCSDDIKMSLSTAMWRWADESPRIPFGAVHTEADGNHHYQHVTGDITSLITPPPPPPTPSPSLSSSSSSSSSPSSRKKLPESSSTSTSSSSSSPPSDDDPRVGVICKKYLYFHDRPLPSRMLNKFTMAAPPWAAKQARKISFWSDVAEGYWLQPESSSDPASPRTPCRLHAESQGQEKKSISNHVLERHCSDKLNDGKYLQFTSSHQHDSFGRYELTKQGSHDYFATETKLEGIQEDDAHFVDQCSHEFALEQEYPTDDQHDYLIHNQPAKRSRSYYPIEELKCSDGVDNDNCIHHDLPVPNNLYVGLKGQHPKIIMNNCSHNCKEHSNAWLSAYLNRLADALRRGRWCEADIHDMLLQYTPEKSKGVGMHSCLSEA